MHEQSQGTPRPVTDEGQAVLGAQRMKACTPQEERNEGNAGKLGGKGQAGQLTARRKPRTCSFEKKQCGEDATSIRTRGGKGWAWESTPAWSGSTEWLVGRHPIIVSAKCNGEWR